MRCGAAGGGLLDVEEQVRSHELPTVRDQRVEARHLQRRDQQILLADRELDRVTRLPELVERRREGLLAPLRGREQSAVLGAYVDAGTPAEPEAARDRLQRVTVARRQPVELVPEPVEVRVARDRQRLRQI